MSGLPIEDLLQCKGNQGCNGGNGSSILSDRGPLPPAPAAAANSTPGSPRVPSHPAVAQGGGGGGQGGTVGDAPRRARREGGGAAEEEAGARGQARVPGGGRPGQAARHGAKEGRRAAPGGRRRRRRAAVPRDARRRNPRVQNPARYAVHCSHMKATVDSLRHVLVVDKADDPTGLLGRRRLADLTGEEREAVGAMVDEIAQDVDIQLSNMGQDDGGHAGQDGGAQAPLGARRRRGGGPRWRRAERRGERAAGTVARVRRGLRRLLGRGSAGRVVHVDEPRVGRERPGRGRRGGVGGRVGRRVRRRPVDTGIDPTAEGGRRPRPREGGRRDEDRDHAGRDQKGARGDGGGESPARGSCAEADVQD
ncbi:hypothetical protein THAOC_19747 [Thalassiosira oceanica]|uniref:Uncharacterized protein n=1 Tax=Thalassiosira oceanica TaxID=159749 RepID=K0S537_THAOC|nr:hypothetical protein THAOC_19747 [Thalassiosira oceanica]|eukprot:EJK59974.1 hypothetical protein THAOC_19747 [Thalassiosira oceanica]